MQLLRNRINILNFYIKKIENFLLQILRNYINTL